VSRQRLWVYKDEPVSCILAIKFHFESIFNCASLISTEFFSSLERQFKTCNIMEDLTTSLESLVSNPPQPRILSRPDLDGKDFYEVDMGKVDEFRKVFVGGRFISVLEDKQTTPNIVEHRQEPFASGNMAVVFGGAIKSQCFAFKRSWISVYDNREAYNKEIRLLQTLRESVSWHVVQLVGHYTRPDNEGCLVLSPLAECTLDHYISQTPTLGQKIIVMRWFGCLAGALRNIHQQNIKHKDIKTKNILVHGENIIITDLGISNKFTEKSTSLGDSPGSVTYMAPEVLEKGRRGRQQDVWSLICCFIEMLCFITDITVSDFRRWCNPHVWLFNFISDYDRVIAWLNRLKSQTGAEAHLALIDLLITGLKKDPRDRPTADYLFDRLRHMGTFVGECCAIPQPHNRSESERLSLSLSTNPELLNRGSLSYFIVSAGRRIIERLDVASIRASINELLEDIESERVRSFRSAERGSVLYCAGTFTCNF
jgi:serine/threonine protein kinase